MDRETNSGLDGQTLFTWGTTAQDAIAMAAKIMDLPTDWLNARYTGLTRPGSYDYDGNAIDGYKEATGNTLRRYAVTMKEGK